MSPTAYLESLGFWGPGTLAAHGVWVDDADIEILKRRQVGISHNPESNMKLASGTAPVLKYLSAGVRIGLVRRRRGQQQRPGHVRGDAAGGAAGEARLPRPDGAAGQAALDLATIGGARALGMEAAIGSLERAKKADSSPFPTSRARQTPLYDPVSHLVYVTRGDDVRTTIVNGKVLMKDGQVRTRSQCRHPRGQCAGAESAGRRQARVTTPIYGRFRYCSA